MAQTPGHRLVAREVERGERPSRRGSGVRDRPRIVAPGTSAPTSTRSTSARPGRSSSSPATSAPPRPPSPPLPHRRDEDLADEDLAGLDL